MQYDGLSVPLLIVTCPHLADASEAQIRSICYHAFLATYGEEDGKMLLMNHRKLQVVQGSQTAGERKTAFNKASKKLCDPVRLHKDDVCMASYAWFGCTAQRIRVPLWLQRRARPCGQQRKFRRWSHYCL